MDRLKRIGAASSEQEHNMARSRQLFAF